MKNLGIRTIKLIWKILKLQVLLTSCQKIAECIMSLYFIIYIFKYIAIAIQTIIHIECYITLYHKN